MLESQERRKEFENPVIVHFMATPQNVCLPGGFDNACVRGRGHGNTCADGSDDLPIY